MREHLSPDRPVMFGPHFHIKPVRNIFSFQNFGELDVSIFTDIPIRSSQYDLHLPDSRVGSILYEVHGIVVIHIIVIKAIELVFYIEGAAHAENVAYPVGMFEGKINCMIPAKTASRCANFSMTCFMHRPRSKLMVKHVVVMDMVFYPFSRMRTFVVPTIPVYRIDAVDLYQTLVHKPGGAIR